MNEQQAELDRIVQLIRSVVEFGQAVVTSEVEDVQSLVGRLEEYMKAFESLQSLLEGPNGFASKSEAAQKELRPILEELSLLHKSVTDWALDRRDAVAHSLTDLQKRSQAVKAYLNRYPTRVSVTGKRQG